MTLQQFCFSFTGRIDRTSYWAYGFISIFILLVVALMLGSADDAIGGFIASYCVPKIPIYGYSSNSQTFA